MPIAPEYLHHVHPGPFPALLYGRASRDPKKKGRSVGDQLGDGRDLCERHGWPIVHEFKDVDRSASRHARRRRDDFEDMLEAIEDGACRIVVAFEASRYYRDLEAYIRLRNACAAAGVLLCYNGTVYDLSKREDRKLTAQDAIAAEDEAEGIRDRVLRTVRRTAKKGSPHGRILWGYARRYDPDTGDLIEQYPHPERAPAVADVFERVAAGETEYAILQRLNDPETGIERAPGIRWAHHHLIAMLRNPAYIGRRVHQGKDIGKAAWPPIVEETLFYTVQAIVRDPARLTTRDWSIRHLLSGIARCGECEERPHMRVIKVRGVLTYACALRHNTSMRKALFDAYVEESVIAWLRSDAAVAAFRSDGQDKRAAAARARMDHLNAQLAEARQLAGEFGPDGTPRLSIASLAALESSLTPQIAAAQSEAEETTVPPLLRGLAGRPDVDRAWEELTVEQQRAVLRKVVDIRLRRASAKGRRRLEPGRIELTFAGEPGFTGGRRPVPVPGPARPGRALGQAPERG